MPSDKASENKALVPTGTWNAWFEANPAQRSTSQCTNCPDFPPAFTSLGLSATAPPPEPMAPPDTRLSMTDSGETGWVQKFLSP